MLLVFKKKIISGYSNIFTFLTTRSIYP